MNPTLGTEIIKHGSRTVFVDVRRAKNESVYVTITALGKNKEGVDERHVITLFGTSVVELSVVLAKIVKEHEKDINRPYEPATVQA